MVLNGLVSSECNKDYGAPLIPWHSKFSYFKFLFQKYFENH